jgi:hypothetical protein
MAPLLNWIKKKCSGLSLNYNKWGYISFEEACEDYLKGTM